MWTRREKRGTKGKKCMEDETIGSRKRKVFNNAFIVKLVQNCIALTRKRVWSYAREGENNAKWLIDAHWCMHISHLNSPS